MEVLRICSTIGEILKTFSSIKSAIFTAHRIGRLQGHFCLRDLLLIPSQKQFKIYLNTHFIQTKVYLLYVEKYHQRSNLAALLITHCNESYYIIKRISFLTAIHYELTFYIFCSGHFVLIQRHNYVISMRRTVYELLINFKSVD